MPAFKAEQAGEEEILCQFGLSDGITWIVVGRGTYEEGHGERVQNQDKEELEEVCRVMRGAGHPIRAVER